MKLLFTLTLALSPLAYAGFKWDSTAHTASLYSVGSGQGLQYSLPVGGTSSGGNPSHILQGVDVRFEAYDESGDAMTLTLADLAFTPNWNGNGHQYSLLTDIGGRIKITYDFAQDWVSNQTSSSAWDSAVAGASTPWGIESKFVFVNNAADYNFTLGWKDDGALIDPNLAFLTGDGISYPATTTPDPNPSNTIGTGVDGTGTGNYIFGTSSTSNLAGESIRWDGTFDLNPYENSYDSLEINIYPTGGQISSGTAFGFTTNGAVLAPSVVPEPSLSLLAGLGACSLLIRRKR